MEMFSSPAHGYRLWGPSTFLSKGYHGILPRGWSGRGAKLWTPSILIYLLKGTVSIPHHKRQMLWRSVYIELVGMWREEVVAQFEGLSQHLPGGTEKNHENVRRACLCAEIWIQDISNKQQEICVSGDIPPCSHTPSWHGSQLSTWINFLLKYYWIYIVFLLDYYIWGEELWYSCVSVEILFMSRKLVVLIKKDL